MIITGLTVSVAQQTNCEDRLAFVRNHVAQLFPTYWIACLLAFVPNLPFVSEYMHPASLLFLTAVAFHPTVFLGPFDGHPFAPWTWLFVDPAWYLAHVAAFYVYFPFVQRTFKCLTTRVVACSIVVLLVAITVVKYTIRSMYYHWLPSRAPFFLLGVLLSRLIVNYKPLSKQTAPTMSILANIICALILLVDPLCVCSWSSYRLHRLKLYHLWINLFDTARSLVMLYPLCISCSMASRLLSSNLMLQLDRYTYAMLLCHRPALYWVHTWVGHLSNKTVHNPREVYNDDFYLPFISPVAVFSISAIFAYLTVNLQEQTQATRQNAKELM